jgi:hypothetical protein
VCVCVCVQHLWQIIQFLLCFVQYFQDSSFKHWCHCNHLYVQKKLVFLHQFFPCSLRYHLII